jgi:monofunctional glycosyltransferase
MRALQLNGSFGATMFKRDKSRRNLLDRRRAGRKKLPGARGGFAWLVRWICLGVFCAFAAVFVLILLLRWIPVPTSAFILSHYIDGKRPEYQWVSWSDISMEMPIAVVAAEDQRFPLHRGLDFDAIADAMAANQKRSNPRGGSTITQQVAKNLFLWPGKNWIRKGLEAALTLAIELCWPKQRILEVYMNIAQFGPSTFGVGAASQRYFQIPPSQLSGRQAALLAAVLPNPKRYPLSPPSPYVRQRAAAIQVQVGRLGGPAYLNNL